MTLYAATGDAIARIAESGDAWRVRVSLSGSGAQCLAVDPADGDTVYAGLREAGVRRTTDGGSSWSDCALPAPGVFSLAVSAADVELSAATVDLARPLDRTEPSRRRSSSRRDRAGWADAVD